MKKLILIFLAIVGVLAPCVVTVNICRACDEERIAIVECIDVDREAIASQDGARLRIHIVNAVDKVKRCFKELVVTAVSCGYSDCDSEKPKETRKTFCHYARQAGGLPSDTLSPI